MSPLFNTQMNVAKMNLLYKSAPLHDIGKVAVPDNILLKKGKLTTTEFEMMKKHTIFGGEALKGTEETLRKNSFLQVAYEIAYYHHEKWNGMGNPKGLKKENIPLSARIMAIADVYDALTSKRRYKPPFSHIHAVSIIQKDSGLHFDPKIVDIFMLVNEKFRKIASDFADTEEERRIVELNEVI